MLIHGKKPVNNSGNTITPENRNNWSKPQKVENNGSVNNGNTYEYSKPQNNNGYNNNPRNSFNSNKPAVNNNVNSFE